MLQALGEGSIVQLDDLKTELRHALRLNICITNEVILSKLTTVVFDLIETNVTAQVAQYFDQGKQLTPQMRASIAKMAGNVAAATTRNADILSHLDDLVGFRKVEQELKAAYRNSHSKMRLPHAGTTRQVPYSQLFVQPFLIAADTQARLPESAKERDLPSLLGETHRLVLLGDPGGGKSTSAIKLAHDINAGKARGLPATICFLVVLRDFAREYSEQKLSLVDYIITTTSALYHITVSHASIEHSLLNGRAVLVFDGLDELLDTSLRREIVQAVEGFCHRFPTTPVLVTSRKVGYEEAPLDPDLFHEVHLDRFSFSQVREYAEKWFKLDASVPNENRKALTDAFLSDSQFVRDLTSNPLLLSLMCGLYASERYIPKNRPDVYERCALLLFEKWDRQRGIVAPLPFDAHVQSAMRALALWLYPRTEAQTGLSRGKLIEWVRSYLLEKRFDNEDDAEQAATEFIDFCKGRAWVLTDVGAELYGFTHRTFLEYFAASQLVKTKRSARSLFAELWPHIKRAEWEVVAQLSLQILGKSVDDGADDFLHLLVERSIRSKRPIESYNGLAFACRALNFIVPRPAVLRLIVESVVDSHCSKWGTVKSPSRSFTALAEGISGVALENQKLTAKYFENRILERLKAEPMDQPALLLAWSIVDYGRNKIQPEAEEFWELKQEEYAELLSSFIEVQARTIPWVATKLAVQKAYSLKELFSKFGMSALFDPHQTGDLLMLPPAYLACATANGLTMRDMVLTEAQLAEFYEILIESDFPWLRDRRPYREIAFVGTVPGLMQKVSPTHRSVAVLAKLALWEVRWPHARSATRVRRNRSRLLFSFAGDLEEPGARKFWRTADDAVEADSRISEKIIGPLNLLPGASDLVVRWFNGELSFVGNPK
ncbi:NACHT domain-containing protein [Kribbella sp. NPDC006257]|uniref:NACHT domain-containing protein n=1 Tax=Kribbella sp. NPDC006257 TaxID=3156738 RepID=UPI0033BC6B31